MKRQSSQTIEQYLSLFPCVAILGARQVGKSTLVRQIQNKLSNPTQPWRYYDLEDQADFDQISQDPGLFLRKYPNHLIFDEAQDYPELFAALRVAIDANRLAKGRFIITGSSSPELLKQISESLAGRIAILELSPLTYSEVLQVRRPLIMDLLKPDFTPELINADTSQNNLQHLDQFFFSGGYPEPWLSQNPQFIDTWYSQYSKTYVERDIGRLFPRLNSVRFRRFLGILASHSGEILNYTNMAQLLDVSQPTIKDYLEIAQDTFVWRNLPAFDKQVKKRIVKHPKGYLRDPGLTHHLLQIPNKELLMSHIKMGHTWEAFVTEEILRTLNNFGIDYQAYHYRTSAGGEIDLIIEGKFGLIPIEIKYGQTIKHQGLRTLKDFVTTYNCPCAFVINNGKRAYFITEKLLSIPFSLLTQEGPEEN